MAEATAALVPAAKIGNLPTVEDCIAKGANIDVTGEVGGLKDREATKGGASMAEFLCCLQGEKKGSRFPIGVERVPMSSGLMPSSLLESVPMSSDWVSGHNERNTTKEGCVDSGVFVLPSGRKKRVPLCFCVFL